MRDLTHGRTVLRVNAQSLKQLIEAMDLEYPGIKYRLYESGQLRKDIMVIVDGKALKTGLEQTLTDESEIRFIPIVTGG